MGWGRGVGGLRSSGLRALSYRWFGRLTSSTQRWSAAALGLALSLILALYLALYLAVDLALALTLALGGDVARGMASDGRDSIGRFTPVRRFGFGYPL